VINAFALLLPDSKEFAPTMDKLISDSKFNPIYSSAFDSYYEEVSNHKFINLSLLVMHGNQPIIGFLQNIEINADIQPKIGYFGRSAALVSSRSFEVDLVDSATQILENYIKNDINNILFKNSEVFGEIRINNPIVFQTTFVENLIRKFTKVETRFSRIVDLNQEEEEILAAYSKSVKSALSKKLSDSQKIEIVDQNSPRDIIESSFGSLKSLHLDSAGKLTRSLQSWKIQKQFLINGNAFIVQLLSHGNVISSAYFMITDYDCYYGVSASAPKISGVSLSHLCISEGIAYSKKLGLQTFHLGEQYSYLSHKITDKEFNIEKFKSFFGGDLFLEVLLLK
jgi:hypothetical protein